MYFICANLSVSRDDSQQPCNPSPCGANAVCKDRNGFISCTCIKNFHGDPYQGCRPECVMNTDCSSDKTCFNNKCIDPCLGTCGINTECRITNHAPSCFCLQAYTGNPLHACSPIISKPSFSSIYFFISFFILFCVKSITSLTIQLLRNQSTPATLHHVALTVNVVRLIITRSVHVSIYVSVLRQIVDLSVLLVLSVDLTKHA